MTKNNHKADSVSDSESNTVCVSQTENPILGNPVTLAHGTIKSRSPDRESVLAVACTSDVNFEISKRAWWSLGLLAHDMRMRLLAIKKELLTSSSSL
jgi:hypothetical protein